jgi:hypothetical protein
MIKTSIDLTIESWNLTIGIQSNIFSAPASITGAEKNRWYIQDRR